MTIEKTLSDRSNESCELCSSKTDLQLYIVPPETEPKPDNALMVCKVCHEQIADPDQMNAVHWRCLGKSMRSDIPAVKVMVWRLLKRLAENSWARDLLEQHYLDDETLRWAQHGQPEAETDDDTAPTKDSS